MPRLSVCIATLNRANFIGETLRGILDQATDEVEVVVVDGASTDGTDAVVNDLFDGRARCRYVRLAVKGGVDQDYCRAVDEASGEFCWLMSDDDVLKPGAVSALLGLLTPGRDLVVVNAEVCGPDLSETLIPRKAPVERNLEFGPGGQAQLLEAAGDLLSFIGSVVVRRSVWKERDRATYYGTEFVHVGVLFQRPLARSALVIADPLIRIRYGNAQWAGRAFEIWTFQWPGLVWSFPHLPDASKAAVCPREPWRRLGHLLAMKARGCYSVAHYRWYLAEQPMTMRERLQSLFLAAFPGVLFNVLAGGALFLVPGRFRATRLELRQNRDNVRTRVRRGR